MKSGVNDTDNGFGRMLSGIRALQRSGVSVGIDDEAAARYAPFVEADSSPFRDAADSMKGMRAIVQDAADGSPRKGLEKAADELVAAVKRNLEERGLVDTGRLRDSVKGVAR